MSRILAIDDDDDILELLRDLLTDEGYDVEVCAEPVLNFPAGECSRPDLIILDYLFYGQPYGWPLLQALKQNAVTAQIPVVVCTIAPRVKQEMQDYLDSAGLEILAKPFHVDDLVRRIDAALRPDGTCTNVLDRERTVGSAAPSPPR